MDQNVQLALTGNKDWITTAYQYSNVNVDMVYSTVETMRIVCTNSQFGPTLYDMLTPVDLRSLQFAFGIHLTHKQTSTYMRFWRQAFVSMKWFEPMRDEGFKLMLTGRCLRTFVELVKDPYNHVRKSSPMRMDLILCVGAQMCAATDDDSVFQGAMRVHNYMTVRKLQNNDVLVSALRDGVKFEFAYDPTAGNKFMIETPGEVVTEVMMTNMVMPSRVIPNRYAYMDSLEGKYMVSHQDSRSWWYYSDGPVVQPTTNKWISPNTCLDLHDDAHMRVDSFMEADRSHPTLEVFKEGNNSSMRMYKYSG